MYQGTATTFLIQAEKYVPIQIMVAFKYSLVYHDYTYALYIDIFALKTIHTKCLNM